MQTECLISSSSQYQPPPPPEKSLTPALAYHNTEKKWRRKPDDENIAFLEPQEGSETDSEGQDSVLFAVLKKRLKCYRKPKKITDYTTLDLSQTYFQVPLKEGCKVIFGF